MTKAIVLFAFWKGLCKLYYNQKGQKTGNEKHSKQVDPRCNPCVASPL